MQTPITVYIFTRAKLCWRGTCRHRVSICLSQVGVLLRWLNLGSTTPYDSQRTLVFWCQQSLVRDFPILPEICAQSDPPPFPTQRFRRISTHSASTVRADEKRSISTDRKSTTRFPTSHRWAVYVTTKSPKGWHKTRFWLFWEVKFNFCRKKSATKFLCVKTSSSKVIATSFPYLTVYRLIAGDVPIYLKFALKWPTPFRKRRFRRISLNSASAVRDSVKNSIIANRKLIMRFLSSHRWTLCVTPTSPKGWPKTKIFTFCVAFYIFVAGNRRHFKFGMLVEHSKSQL